MPIPQKRIIPIVKNQKDQEAKKELIIIPPIVSANSLSSMEKIRNSIKECHQCKGLNKKMDQLEECSLSVPPFGNLESKIMFIEQYPYTLCQETGDPFPEELNALLSRILNKFSISQDQIFKTTVVKCHIPKTGTLSEQEKVNCKIFLEREIEIIEPELIIPIGIVSLQFFFPKIIKMADWDGKVISRESFFICPISNPLLSSSNEKILEEKIKNFLNLLKKEEKVEDEEDS